MSATPSARVGHVHLRVANLDRAIDLYEGILVLADGVSQN
jgi:catechol-2,3-dioxygenase